MAPQKNMKVMKAMKVKKAHLKRPSADLDLPKKDQGMSLEEKMELFKKKGNQDVSSFLDSLTKTQRESLWHRDQPQDCSWPTRWIPTLNSHEPPQRSSVHLETLVDTQSTLC